jgi:hypothetical protein
MTTTARRDTLMLLAVPALACAMLTVALALMDANRAPWWAQLATGMAVLVTAVVLGVQIERVQWRREKEVLWRARLEFVQSARQRPLRAGGSLRDGDDPVDVYWTERAPSKKEEEQEA